ncbi:hypothetical protein MAL08_18750 [Leptospira noguchii]|nr:hypothetical protein [Leptospira noguchii]UOG39650.1 hypothetical protein MAL08_18750 [Leptospira noguchii]
METKAQRFPELSVSLLGSLDRSRWKLNTTLSYGSRCGIKLLVFYEN